MIRIPDFQSDLLFSETAAPADGAKAETPAAEVKDHSNHEATTTEAPLAPQVTGVLEPISGGQTFALVMFGVLAFCLGFAMTRFGKSQNYGD